MLIAVLSFVLGVSPCGVLDDAVAVARRDREPASLQSAAALLPGPLSQRVRDELGRGGVEAGLPLLERALDVTCGARADAPSMSTLQALRAGDDRFVGVRSDDLSERMLDKLWRALETLFESEAMQRFSEQTRTVYVTLLGAVVVFVAVRVWRRSRKAVSLEGGQGIGGRVEHRRRATFAELRDRASLAIDRDPRAAMLWLRRALLACVGDIDERAVRPSRTSAEIVARLTPSVAILVAPPLQTFDRAFFGADVGDVDEQQAARVLASEVDAAAAAILSRQERS